MLRIAIVGPGRVGRAFGRRLSRQRVRLLGFVGRDAAAGVAAAAWCGAGRGLQMAELGTAHVVVFAVGDGELAAAVAAAATANAGARQATLWLHTSGRHGLEVFAAAGHPRRRFGALHPVAPFPDAETGCRTMTGAPAVLLGGAEVESLLVRLSGLLGLEPIPAGAGDRVLYHAACALAANGLTALRALVDGLFAAAGGLAPAASARLAGALMANALRACDALGPGAALSGPVRRGDAATVAAHLASIGAAAPETGPAYRALMRAALALAEAQGLPAERAAAVRAALDGGGPGRVSAPFVD